MGSKKLKKEEVFFNSEELENSKKLAENSNNLADEEFDDLYLTKRKSYKAHNRKFKHFERRRMGDEKFNQRIEHIFAFPGNNN